MKNQINTHIKTIILQIIVCIFVAIGLNSCNKDKNSLYSISISPNNMVGTPAEMFSLGQVKMFQASNSLVSSMMENISKDTTINNFAIAPIYLINNIMIDTSLSSWQNAFQQTYNLSTLSYDQRQKEEKDFLGKVKQIDSSINITSKILLEDDSAITISQSLDLSLMYENIMPNNIDNIFTTIDNKRPRLDFLTINSQIRTLNTNDEQANEIAIGNGNYMLMMIMPKHQTIKEYLQDFTEEKYSTILNQMKEKNTTISFPLIEMQDTIHNVQMPNYQLSDSTISFTKRLDIIFSFSLRQGEMKGAEMNSAMSLNNRQLQVNNSEIMRYSSPFLFIIRGKNSNLIMFMGVYCRK
jgi:hypothetical protein